jgi:hypothetical protein
MPTTRKAKSKARLKPKARAKNVRLTEAEIDMVGQFTDSAYWDYLKRTFAQAIKKVLAKRFGEGELAKPFRGERKAVFDRERER